MKDSNTYTTKWVHITEPLSSEEDYEWVCERIRVLLAERMVERGYWEVADVGRIQCRLLDEGWSASVAATAAYVTDEDGNVVKGIAA